MHVELGNYMRLTRAGEREREGRERERPREKECVCMGGELADNGNIKCFSQWVWGQRSQSAYRHISHLVMINYGCVAMATSTLIACIQQKKKKEKKNHRALMKQGRETCAAV